MSSSSVAGHRVAPSVKGLLQLAWPIIVSRATQVVIGLCDALMVASLGEAALAATVTGAMNAYSVLILPIGTVAIVGTFASQYFGSGDLAGARRSGWYGLLIALATQGIGLLVIPVLGVALDGFSFAPEVQRQMEDYLAIRFVAAGAVVGLEGLAAYYGGIGNTRLPMLANLGVMALNVAGNWILIGGRFGFPALGVRGAAWASVISTVVGFLVLLLVFVWRRGDAPRVPKLSGSEFFRVLRFGLPSGLNWFFEFFAFLFFINVVVAGLGTVPLAAFMSVFQINSVAFMPAFAVASAGAIVVGQAIGAGRLSDVPKAVGLAFVVSACWQSLVGVSFLVAPRVIFGPFASGATASELIDVGARVLMLSVAWQLFDAASMTLAESLRAAGDTAFSMWSRIAIGWCLFVPGTWLTVRVGGGNEFHAVAWLVVYMAALALVLFARFRGGAWKTFQVLPPEQTPGVARVE